MTTGSLSRFCAVGALVLLGATTVSQLSLAPPTYAAGTTVALFAWGDNSNGELGNGNTTNSDTPQLVPLPAGVTPVATAGGGGGGDRALQWAAYAIGSDKKVYAWGDNSSGELGNGTTGGISESPVVVSLPAGVTPTAIAAGQGVGYAIGSDGQLYAWGPTPTATSATGPRRQQHSGGGVSPFGGDPDASPRVTSPATPSARTGTSTPGETTSTGSSATGARQPSARRPWWSRFHRESRRRRSPVVGERATPSALMGTSTTGA